VGFGVAVGLAVGGGGGKGKPDGRAVGSAVGMEVGNDVGIHDGRPEGRPVGRPGTPGAVEVGVVEPEGVGFGPGPVGRDGSVGSEGSEGGATAVDVGVAVADAGGSEALEVADADERTGSASASS
jgi:hypothetical protein